MFKIGDKVVITSSFNSDIEGKQGVIVGKTNNYFWVVQVDIRPTMTYSIHKENLAKRS